MSLSATEGDDNDTMLLWEGEKKTVRRPSSSSSLSRPRLFSRTCTGLRDTSSVQVQRINYNTLDDSGYDDFFRYFFFSIFSQLVTCFVSYRSFSFLLFFLFNFVSGSFFYLLSISFVYLLVGSNYNYIVRKHEISLDGSDLSCVGIRKKRDALLKKLHHL